MAKPLIIVESPTKTRTLKSFLGGKFEVEASVGHVRDLPEWGMGVDVENGFHPQYEVMKGKKQVIDKLKRAAKSASAVYLASDPDREGEAIAWHLAEALELKSPQRIVYNEITKTAVEAAIQQPRPIDQAKVSAQEARRILDRLVGYRLSPLLSKKIRSKLSAGRVQSVAVRMVCEREREINAFVPVEYWSLTATLTPQSPEPPFPFTAKYVGIGSKKADLPNEATSQSVLSALEGASYAVKSIKQQERRRNPQAPFITSTLQQEASRKLSFANAKTMKVAQELYEGIEANGEHVGLITYMRTDSTRIAAEAQAQAKGFIEGRYGANYSPAKPPSYANKKAAQDAHEAIRPTDVAKSPESLAAHLSADQLKLYTIVWQRFVASQMAPAVFDVTTADIDAKGHTFRATGSVVRFDGFMRVYSEGKDTEEVADEDQSPLPRLAESQLLDLIELLPKQHFTEPPPRFTEATLVKTMEEKGIGRPSTYAAIIKTIVDRKYVKLDSRRFSPTELGFQTNDMLVANFPTVLDVGFTAGMENELDDVEEGKADKVTVLSEFYGPFSDQVTRAFDTVESLKPQAVETEHACPTCGKPMMLRQGPRGPFLGCSGYPKCKTLVNVDEQGNPVDTPRAEVTDHSCPLCGKPMMKREGKRGPFLGCTGYPKCRGVVNLDEDGNPAAEPTVADQKCEKCGKPMIRREGKRGPFLGCSGYPRCRNIVDLAGDPSAEPGTAGSAAAESSPACPECGKDMAKKFAGRRPFWGCTGYPECTGTLPIAGRATPAAKSEVEVTDQPCPNCGAPLAKRSGRFGPFLGCTAYPKCKTIVKIGKEASES